MNRRQRIIVSITGIFLVLLMLVGLTYAYFLTQINGNINPNSIQITTANLQLTYSDGDGSILTSDTKLKPSNTPINTKEFSVINNGDDTDYVVIIDNISIKNATTGEDTTFESNDFEFKLECSSDDGIDCNDINIETPLPLINNSILIGNDIKSGATHTYTLTLWYKETNKNQSRDMNKMLNARINIQDIRRLNPYSDNETSLAYNIVNNAISKNTTNTVALLSNTLLNNTKYKKTKIASAPDTKVAEQPSAIMWSEVYPLNVVSSIGQTSLSVSDPQVIINAFNSNFASLATCLDSNYQPTHAEGCADLKLGFTSCEEVEGKYIYNTSLSNGYYVNECRENEVEVYSLFYGTNIDDYNFTEEQREDFENSGEFNKDNERVLTIALDDYGTSYYYRGDIEDNYVNFAGMCFRIVRIDGNGNVKLILEDKNTTCDSPTFTGNWSIGSGNYGYDATQKSTDGKTLYKMNYLNPKTDAENSMVKAFYDFQNTLKTEIQKNYNNKAINNYLKSGDWCLDDIAYERIPTEKEHIYEYTLINDKERFYATKKEFVYDSYLRLSGSSKNGYMPTLKCNGIKLDTFNNVEVNGNTITKNEDMYVGTLTADEVMYAGSKSDDGNNGIIYLSNDEFKKGEYGEINSEWFWSLSSNSFNGFNYDGIYIARSSGEMLEAVVNQNDISAFRPAILLKNNVEISNGIGTIFDPYEIK